ncbi:Inactive (p)ppGpp 3'-pyrophosphohydrolase domain / GTP pyrophosphokinase, (p)ppGpp synthetase I [hydrothermal vent metagenome]|uniref:Inactive (P)ppGpp 3'-pyrophosphohydrolase domain / GTP pyrophosphokinase, (P)ppGpp synthetase I n=1 Tax=hydrothermal vent metagenome TaxID=652676 RepID=A0A3B0ZEK7_9ZZZZ
MMDMQIQSTILENFTNNQGVNDWLVNLGVNNSADQVSLIYRAFEFARDAHAQQIRASGELHITHTVAVAEILATLHLDHETLAAAILHDVIEDTDKNLPQLEEAFGSQISHLVDGVTKMNIIDQQVDSFSSDSKYKQGHTESLRKLLLAMAEDVRVVLIKLADRLHNMRTLKYLPEYKQKRIAHETLDIYAPLANRLGIWQMKWELEDLSLRYIEPRTYKKVAEFLDERRVDREEYIARVTTVVTEALRNSNINAEVTGRPKHIYSIWRKMKRKGIRFNELYDVRAVRVVVESIADCYSALGVIHSKWRHIPKEFDDYIATPKENMYQSIHSAVVGPEGKTLEVQIRTKQMNEHAELGIAAHWRYKEGSSHNKGYEQKIAWLRQLLQWKEESEDDSDFIDRFKSEVFEERVYVLTPNGDIIDMSQGATPLDFAYHIHSEVGHRCRGAKVNGRIVPLTYELKNADQVEILTNNNGTPSRDWLNNQLGYLNTSRARSHVRHWFKLQDSDMNIDAGKHTLEKELHRLRIKDVQYSEFAEYFKFKTTDDFFSAIGRGDINSSQLSPAAANLSNQNIALKQKVKISKPKEISKSSNNISVQGVGNLLTNFATCCKPVMGDDIIGYITNGRGVTIHRRDCKNILNMSTDMSARLIAVDWNIRAEQIFPVGVIIEAIDRKGLLRDITSIVANENINLISVNTLSNKSENTAKMKITIEISNVDELSRVLIKIEQLPNIFEAYRSVE